MSLVYVAMDSQEPNNVNNIDLKACRACFDTENVLHDIQKSEVSHVFGDFTGIPVTPTDGYPQYLCTHCLYLTKKFFKFRLKCHSAMYMLQQARLLGDVNIDTIKAFDRIYLKHNLICTELAQINIANESIAEETDKQTHRQTRNATREALKALTALNIKKNDEELNLPNDDVKFNEEKLPEEDVKLHEEKFEVIEIKCEDSSLDVDVVSSDEDSDYKKPLIKLERNSKSNIKEKKVAKVRNKVDKVKNKIDKVKNKVAKVKKRATLKRLKENEDVTDDLTGFWRKIVKEIDEENSRSNSVRRRRFLDSDIQFLAKKAEKFAQAYNVDVRFLTAEEQILEREERRTSESFIKGLYKCELCVKVFVTEDTYKRHCERHSPDMGNIVCEICKYRFQNIRLYRGHFSLNHTKKIICKECGVISRFWAHAKTHHQWHNGIKIACDHCDMKFSARKLLMMHLRNKHRVGSTRCQLCHQKFIGTVGLKIHMDKIHKLAVKCDKCNNHFNDYDVLRKHEVSGRGECGPDISACSLCGLCFPTDAMLKDHHDDLHRKLNKCDWCNKCFKTDKKLAAHMKLHLQPEKKRTRRDNLDDKPSSCNICTDDKCEHVSQGATRQYKCQECTRSFYQMGNLKKHIQMKHEDEDKRFVCEVCGLKKQSLAHLKYHQRVHTGERPFPCPHCNKRFAQNQTLKCHIATHTGERAHICSLCGKAFKQRAHLIAHMLTHTKERPYACTLCEKRYRCATALKEHNDTAHRGLPHRRWGKRGQSAHAGNEGG